MPRVYCIFIFEYSFHTIDCANDNNNINFKIYQSQIQTPTTSGDQAYNIGNLPGTVASNNNNNNNQPNGIDWSDIDLTDRAEASLISTQTNDVGAVGGAGDRQQIPPEDGHPRICLLYTSPSPRDS